MILDAAWRNAARLAPHRPYFYYTHPEEFPCDDLGFRIPTGFESLRHKFEASYDRKRVFCLGGSTTFGDYCTYDESYPARLEAKTGAAVFNLGLRGLDLHANVYTLTDLILKGLVPDVVVSYDGANEKTGFLQFQRGNEEFRTEHVQYGGFVDIIRAASLKRRLLNLLKGPFKDRSRSVNTDHDKLNYFAEQQAAHYLASKRYIQQLGNAFGFRTLFFLQPTVWQYLGEAKSLRKEYLEHVYRCILNNDSEIMDISRSVKLSTANFIDIFHLDADGQRHVADVISKHVLPQDSG